MAKIVGYEISQGVYNGINYDNVVLHTSSEIPQDKGKGIKTYRNKVKRSLYLDWCRANDIDINNPIGKEVNFYFDRFQNISAME